MFIEIEKKLLNSLETLIKSNDVNINIRDYINFKGKIKQIRAQNYSILYNIDFQSDIDYICWDNDINGKFHKFKVYSFNKLILDLDFKNIDLNNKDIKAFIELINESKTQFKNFYKSQQNKILKGNDHYKKMICEYISFHNNGLKKNQNLDILKPKLEQINKEIKKQGEKRMKLKDRLKELNDKKDLIENIDIKANSKNNVIIRKNLNIERNENNNLKIMEFKINNRGSQPIKVYKLRPPKMKKPPKYKSHQQMIADKLVNRVKRTQILMKYINEQKK